MNETEIKLNTVELNIIIGSLMVNTPGSHRNIEPLLLKLMKLREVLLDNTINDF